MSSVLNNDQLHAKDINNDVDNSVTHVKLYELLQEREQCWWQTRQSLINLKERQVFWYGENSLMMWLMWQLVSYVLVAMALMLLSRFLDLSLPLWQYVGLFVIQTAIFVVILMSNCLLYTSPSPRD